MSEAYASPLEEMRALLSRARGIAKCAGQDFIEKLQAAHLAAEALSQMEGVAPVGVVEIARRHTEELPGVVGNLQSLLDRNGA
jgi:hypothetical protein